MLTLLPEDLGFVPSTLVDGSQFYTRGSDTLLASEARTHTYCTYLKLIFKFSLFVALFVYVCTTVYEERSEDNFV